MADELPGFNPDELEGFVEEYLELDRQVQRPQDIYSILPGSREAKYQSTLQYFLNPRRPHGFGNTLLDLFLESIGFHEFNLAGQHVEIDTEVPIADAGTDGRIDLIIAGGSSLADHPDWAVFAELKVGAAEGTRQTPTYAAANTWHFDWFDTNQLAVEALTSTEYVYLKRSSAAPPTDVSFTAIDWADIAKRFETGTQRSLFEYPNRSVIQFTDFIQSLKETEGMDSSIDEEELTERLTLYFDYSDLIQQVEQANSQFESDFDDVSAYLKTTWVDKLTDKYDFEQSGWQTTTSSRAEYQKIYPGYWAQDPLNGSSTIQVFFRHSPTTELLRKQTLRFRLRLPPARNVHTNEQDTGQSFNTVFEEHCTNDYAERITDAVTEINPDDVRLNSASALITKDYPLDPNNLIDSYFEQLDTAVHDFCSEDSSLPTVINDVFTATYRRVFDKEPAGAFTGGLSKNP